MIESSHQILIVSSSASSGLWGDKVHSYGLQITADRVLGGTMRG